MKRFALLVLLVCSCTTIIYGQANDTISSSVDTNARAPKHTKLSKKEMMPKFTATVLGRYEYNTQLNKHHFELRHSRVGVYGDLHPMFSYMALVDLSFGGGFSPVAIFAKFKPVKGLSFLIGYDKMPFSHENMLSPYQYYYADKSFLTQKLTAWSDVGGVIEYKWDKVVPFTIKAGVFNSSGFSKQMQFQKSLNYVARGIFNLFKGFELSLNYAAVKYEDIRMHNYDVSIVYEYKGLHLDAEYIYKTYSDRSFKPTHAMQCFAYYEIGINKVWFDNIAVTLRYDAITPNCTGKLNGQGTYSLDDYKQRITAGLTFNFIQKPVRTGIRLNYEKFFAHKGVECNDDRLILELIVHY